MKKPSSGVLIGASVLVLTVAAFTRVPLLPDIGRELEMSALGLGLIGSVFALGRLAADFPAGRMADHMRPGAMMSISASVVAVGCVALALAPTALTAYGATFVLGLASTLVLTTGMTHFARAPGAKRGVALSAFAGYLLAGQSFGPTFGGAVGDAAGWRWAVAAAAGLALLVAATVHFVREPLPAAEAGTRSERRSPVAQPGRLAIAFLYVVPAAQFSIQGALLQTLVPIVADVEHGMRPATVGLALGIGGVARIVSAIVAGQVSDRVSRRWALVPGQFLQAAGVIVFWLWASPLGWFLAIVGVTLGSVGMNVGTTMLADISHVGSLGRRLASFRFAGDATLLVAPVLAGWLYEIAGREASMLPMVALAVVAAVGVAVWVPETRALPAGDD
jgi:MFS family permease